MDWNGLITEAKDGVSGEHGKQLYWYIRKAVSALVPYHQDREDLMHSCFSQLWDYMAQDRVIYPERMPGLIKVIVLRNYWNSRKKATPEELPEIPAPARINYIAEEQVSKLLGKLKPREREVLERSFLLEQSQEQVMQEMNLNYTQYRLIKSRSLQKLRERARRWRLT